jgi:PKD repeat protein
MHMFSDSRRRFLAIATTLGVVLASVALGSVAPASAAAGPAPVEQRNAQTATADPLPTVQIDSGIVWAQKIVGNTVFAGGSFSNARPAGAAPGTALMPRSNILAYDIRTGVATSFAPQINGQVKSIEASPDGSTLYVGGTFTQVNGQTRYNIAAFNTQTGALSTTFKPAVGGSYVNAIVATGNAVYVGGLIGAGNGVTRKHLAAFTTSGALLGWAPTADLQIDAMVLTPAKDKLIVGGRFGMINGVVQRGLAALDLVNGALLPWEAPHTVVNGTSTGSGAGKAGIFGLTADANAVYGTGWVFADKTVGNLEGIFSAEGGSGAIRWIADCHGDHYGVYSDGTNVYSTSHEHACESAGGMTQKTPAPGNMRNASAVTAAPKGTLSRSPWVNSIYADWSGWPAPAFVNWFPDWTTGTASGQGQAGWTVTGNGTYLVIGGEFPFVNGQRQQGLVRFSNAPAGGPKSGPRLAGANWTPVARSVSSGTVQVSIGANWDRDDLNLSYELYRTGRSTPVATYSGKSTYWNLPGLTFVDRGLAPGSTQSYRVVARDGDGNIANSGTGSVTVSNVATTAYTQRVLDDGASLYWRLGGDAGAAAADWAGTNNGVVGSGVTSTTPGAITDDTGPASQFNGTSDGLISSTRTAPAGDALSVELWFKTNSTLGGKLIGYGAAQSGNSGSYDRHLYMRNDGRLVFGVYPGGVRTVASSSPYNDNQWHQAVGTLGADGLRLYVDGVQVGVDPATTSAQPYDGYWRVGGDNLGGWPDRPSGDYFTGAIDEVAVYPSVLPADSISQHFALGRSTAPPTASFTSTANLLDIAVDAGASTAPSGQTISSYSWDFGDGSLAATGVRATHGYAAAGTYTVSLTVTSSTGRTASQTAVVTMTAHQAPVARFDLTTQALTANVDASASTASDGATLAYSWDWGDGSPAGVGVSASHTFAAGGDYPVTLTVTDSLGATHQVLKTATVTAVPAPGSALATDAFGRAVSNGWGSADTGGSWTMGGPAANFSVAGGVGSMVSTAPGVTVNGFLKSVSSSDTEVRVQVAVDKDAVGGGEFIGVIGRQVGSGRYSAVVKPVPGGTVQLQLRQGSTTLASVTASGVTFVPNEPLQVRLQVFGTSPTTMRAKVWRAGQAEPANWQLSTTDSFAALQVPGSVGLETYLSGQATNAPVKTSFDNLWAGSTTTGP